MPYKSQVKLTIKSLEEFEDYIVVLSGERPPKIAVNHFPASFSSLQTETKVPINREPKSLQHELHQMSSVSISDRGKHMGNDSKLIHQERSLEV